MFCLFLRSGRDGEASRGVFFKKLKLSTAFLLWQLGTNGGAEPGHMQGRHPPVAWTASSVVSRRDSMVFQGGFEMQVRFFRHSSAGGRTDDDDDEFGIKTTRIASFLGSVFL